MADIDINALFGNQTIDMADVITRLAASDTAFGKDIKSKISKLFDGISVKTTSTTKNPLTTQQKSGNPFFDEGPIPVEIAGIDKNILDQLLKNQLKDKEVKVEPKKENFLSKLFKGLLGGAALGGLGGMLSGLLGDMFKIPGKILGNIKKFGPLGLLAGGLIWAAMDAIKSIAKADEWGTSKVAAGLGGFLAGTGDGGVKSIFKNAGKLAMMGIGIGAAFGPLGMLVGGILGAVIGAVAAAIGAEKLAKGFDVLGKKAKEWTGNFIIVLSSLWDKFKEIFGPIWENTILPMLSKIGEIITSIDFNSIFESMKDSIKMLSAGLEFLFVEGKEQFKKLESVIKEFPFKQIIDDITNTIQSIFTWFDLNLFQPLFGSTKEAKKAKLSENINAFKREINGWKEIFDNLWTNAKEFGIMITDVYTNSFKPFFEKAKEMFDIVVGNILREHLIPMFNGLGKWFRDELLPAVRKFIEPITKYLIPPLIKMTGYLAKAALWLGKILLPVISAITILITNVLFEGIKKLGKFVGFLVTGILKGLGKVFEWVGKTFQFFIDFGEALGQGISDLVDWFSKLPKMISDIVNKIKGFFGKEVKDVEDYMVAGDKARAERSREKQQKEDAAKKERQAESDKKYEKESLLGAADKILARDTWRADDIKVEDFISRPGQKVQKFSEKDTLYGAKENGPLEKVFKASFDKMTKTTEQSDKHLQELKTIMSQVGDKLDYIAQINIEMTKHVAAPKQAGQPMPTITQGSGRDPAYDNAYSFRTKVWEILHGVT